MKRFAALIDRLESAHDEETAARALAAWLADAPDPERGVALGLLLGTVPIARAGRTVLAALAQRLDPVLLAISREVAGELAETIALTWPGTGPKAGAGDDAPSFLSIAAELAVAQDRVTFTARLAELLDALAPAERVALLRLATGQITGMLSVRTAQAALALLGDVPLTEVEAAWHAVDPPYEALFAWTEGRAPRPPAARHAPFHHLAVVRAWTSEHAPALGPSALAADHAWDGLRVLAVAHEGVRRLYTRRGEDVGARFPELLALLEDDVALEGVVLVRDAGGRFARAPLDARLGRRPRTGDAAVLMIHDALKLAGESLREQPLRKRRDALETLSPRLPGDRAVLSPLVGVEDEKTLLRLRRRARERGAAGLILKSWDAPYAGGDAWIEWRCEPLTLTAIVLYAEYAMDGIHATTGVWNGDALVPIAKVALDDAEAAERVAAYASEHRVDRFGPVLQLKADAEDGLVAEIAFDAIERAPRRKAGVMLRGARLAAIRDDVSPAKASQLEDIRALLR